MQTPKNILVVPLRFIGDAVLTVPLLRAIKSLYPEASLDVLVPAHLVNLFQTCPYIDNLILEPGSKKELQASIQERNYDLAFLLRRSLTQARLLKKAGVKTLVGYDEQRFFAPIRFLKTGWYLDKVVPFPPVDTDIPQVKTYLNLLSPFSTQAFDETLELWADEYDVSAVDDLFQNDLIDTRMPLAIFHATSASREKAMDPEKFYPALNALQQAGFQIAAVGTPADSEGYDLVSKNSGVPLINLCGLTTLRQTYQLLKQTTLLLSLDSAPVHLAACANVPNLIVIYGPTNEKQWRPYPYKGQFTPVFNTELNCRPCVPKVCSHNKCRVDLTTAQILEATKKNISLESSISLGAV